MVVPSAVLGVYLPAGSHCYVGQYEERSHGIVCCQRALGEYRHQVMFPPIYTISKGLGECMLRDCVLTVTSDTAIELNGKTRVEDTLLCAIDCDWCRDEALEGEGGGRRSRGRSGGK